MSGGEGCCGCLALSSSTRPGQLGQGHTAGYTHSPVHNGFAVGVWGWKFPGARCLPFFEVDTDWNSLLANGYANAIIRQLVRQLKAPIKPTLIDSRRTVSRTSSRLSIPRAEIASLSKNSAGRSHCVTSGVGICRNGGWSYPGLKAWKCRQNLTRRFERKLMLSRWFSLMWVKHNNKGGEKLCPVLSQQDNLCVFSSDF